MSGKRSFDTLSQIDHEEGSADVHFALKVLSPVKKSKSGTEYFDGTASDGNTDLRLVSFHGGLQKKLADLKEKRKPVLIKNCSIRKSRSDDKLEIFVNKNATILPSPKKIECKIEDRPKVTVTEVDNVIDYTQIDIIAKVIKVCPARAVSTGLLQEVTLGDSTGTIVLSCWESNIDKLEENSTYDFKFLTVKSYREEKTLQFSSNTTFTPVDTVVVAEEGVYETTLELKQAEIIGVQNYTVHYSCINCSSKVYTVDDTTFSKCSKCSILQSVHLCEKKVSANLLFSNGEESKLLTAVNHVCEQLLKDSFSSPLDLKEGDTQLLQLKNKMNVTYTTKGNYITAIETQ